jgi:hypothetical protein
LSLRAFVRFFSRNMLLRTGLLFMLALLLLRLRLPS